MSNLKPFTKGKDIRRNVKGRPKDFDAVRSLALKILKEQVSETDPMAKVEKILRDMYINDPEKLLAYGFGKIPDKVESNNITRVIVEYAQEGDPNGPNGNDPEASPEASGTDTKSSTTEDSKSG